MQLSLEPLQQAIIPVAAYTAIGDMPRLRQAVEAALTHKVPINTLKEVMVQLYAYAGFPRSLNALSTLMAIVDQRKQQGINDELGSDATPSSTQEDSFTVDSKNQTKLAGQPVQGPLFDFAPTIDRFLKAHLFGDIFQRDNLSWANRELATLSALAALSGVNSQLKSHYQLSLNAGLTTEQLTDFIKVLAEQCNAEIAANAAQVLKEVH